MRLIIPGSLITLNAYIQAERGNRFAAAQIKKEQTELVYYACKEQRLQPIHRPVDVMCLWYCKNTRTDKDNICSIGLKIILDGLVLAKVLGDDRWDNIVGIRHVFGVDAKHPRVEVILYEMD